MPKPHLPQEILDYVVDFLHDKPEALKECCLVSRSWVPRTRMHLFAEVDFRTEEDLESWKKTFPDPSTSPGCYTRTLTVGSSHVVRTAGVGGWIMGFSRVVSLVLSGYGASVNEVRISFVPLYGF